ncbi:MAG: nitrate reductase cytochrome c-type subunit [Sulfurimicrobium sp.]|nr:nitrate reductase cytochrome c-type subunit [Sulfurimicrobium sp.]
MKNSLRFALVALATSAFSLAATPPALSAESAVKSLRGADAQVSDQAPEEKIQLGKRPGSQKPIARSFEQQPPVIPHATENFDEITLEENQCLTCHGPEKYKEKKSPRIGDSHFRNQQTGEIMKQMSSARHNCMQCHVPQVDTPPLVDNTFQGVPQPKAAARKKQ